MDRLKTVPTADIDDRTYSVLENLLIRTGSPERAVTMALDMLLAGIDTVCSFLHFYTNALENSSKVT